MESNHEFWRLAYFAKACGVSIVRCDPEIWNGPFAYKTEDSPNSTFCGYASEGDAYVAWMENTFGKRAGAELKNIVEAGPVCYFSGQ